MTKKKVLIVFGTRPEAIKMAPVVMEFKKNSDQFETKVCVTAQHREMLDQVLQLFEIEPDYDLNLMKKGQDLYDITSRVLLGMRGILKKEKPDLVLVHGDTTTSSATALAAYYQKIPVGHVEAGLRTNNIYSPWPEEMNRQITGRLASYHFAPTEISRQNLLKERVEGGNIIVTGNTVIDSLHLILNKLKNKQELSKKTEIGLVDKGITKKCIQDWKNNKRLILITAHRRENFGKGFENICRAIKILSDKYPDVDFVYPVHLNPNVQEPVFKYLSNRNNIHLIEPLDYLPFLYLMSLSYIVITDSGGIQEEAPSLGKPVLVMRDTTERPEAVEAGTVVLTGTDTEKIVDNTLDLLEDKDYYQSMSKLHNPYGDGQAAERIFTFLLNTFDA